MAVSPHLPTRVDQLRDVLHQAAQVEHLLANQYLFAAFSLKKYPEEFGPAETRDDEAVWAQIERNRRWEAMILYTAREEMEHLCMVQNLLAILDAPSYLWRPNYPTAAAAFPLGVPFHLLPFTAHTMELFRFYEKPDSLDLPNPFHDSADPRVAELREATAGEPPFTTAYHSVQSLYEAVRGDFELLIKHRWIHGKNPNRVVNEHFGFNLELEPIVQSDYLGYIDDIIALIIEQGEGVGDVPPPLGSHFMAFQDILHEVRAVEKDGSVGDFGLPVVTDPALSGDFHLGRTTVLTHPYTRRAVQLFNDCYILQCRLLTGFFDHYDVDTTTGIHPPEVNAYFRTVFYPMMTMVMRPLGEILCRLPAFEGYEPVPGRLPASTAGPTFEIPVAQGPGNGAAKRASIAPPDIPDRTELGRWFQARLEAVSEDARCLADEVPRGWAGVVPLAGQSLEDRFAYLHENLWRMSVNFMGYWTGEKIAPIPSRDFQDLPGIN